MKSSYSAICTVVFLALASAPVQSASSGTITFSGSVNTETCAAVVNNTNANATITLPAVPSSALGAAGATTGSTAFTINLTGCDAANTKTRAFFEAGAAVNNAGRLNNQATTGATNVELQLVDIADNASPIIAGDYASQSTSGTTIDASSGTGTLNYAVRYYATGAATSGAVSSTVTYSIIYL